MKQNERLKKIGINDSYILVIYSSTLMPRERLLNYFLKINAKFVEKRERHKGCPTVFRFEVTTTLIHSQKIIKYITSKWVK